MQKNEKLISKDAAFKIIQQSFKPSQSLNEVQKLRFQEAHEETVLEILDELADEDGKVKMFKGGRFERIISFEEEKETKTKEMHRKRMQKRKIEKEHGKSAAKFLDEEEEVNIDPDWIDHGPKPRDVTTLILNILQYKLNVDLCLETSMVLSLDGNYIFLVVKADINDMK